MSIGQVAFGSALILFITASTTVSAKRFFANDPRLAGSKIDYCESAKTCQTIDRRNESVPEDQMKNAGPLLVKLGEMAPDFYTLEVTFKRSDKVPGSMDLHFKSSKPGS